jgi:membrane-associated protein
MEMSFVMPLLVVAAVAGDQLNYSVGRFFGPKVWQWEHSRFFNKHAFHQAHDFYEKYGGITIMLARFLPFIRTFVPFVAGVAEMGRRKFTMYNVAGALVWVISLVTAGYLFGNLPWAKANMSIIIWAMIIVPGLIALLGAWKARRNGLKSAG